MKNIYATKPIQDDPAQRAIAEAAIEFQIYIKHDFTDLNPVYYGEATISREYFSITYLRTVHCTNLFFVIDGTCTLYLNGAEMTVNKGDFFVVPLGADARLIPIEQYSMTHRWIGFGGARSFDFFNFPPVFTLPPQIMDRLYDPAQKTRNLGSRLTSDLFLIHSYLKEECSKDLGYVQQVINYVSTEYMNKISVTELAKSFNLDRYYLSKLFKSKMNMSIQDYILQFRIAKAKRYLKHNFTVTDAARLCGFCNRVNLSKAFTREIGCSPTQWVKYLSASDANGPE